MRTVPVVVKNSVQQELQLELYQRYIIFNWLISYYVYYVGMYNTYIINTNYFRKTVL